MSEATAQQRRAIEARGNVLVSAGAGAGKTRTLVERCLRWIQGPERGSVDEALMVTFTEAAATEMRHRLRRGLEAAQEAERSQRLLEQLALLETAQISTLHSFCFHLLSQHFFEVSNEGEDTALDGPISVLSAEKAKLLEVEAMDAVLTKVYEGKAPGATAILDLIKAHGSDWDKPTREMVNRLHRRRHSLRDPEGWLRAQRAKFTHDEPGLRAASLMEALRQWRQSWLRALQPLAEENQIAAQCATILVGLPAKPERGEFAQALEHLVERGKVKARHGGREQRDQIKKIFEEANFLHAVTFMTKDDPLDEDWNWARPSMLALLDLTEAFGRAYARAKRAVGGVDFQDLEQLALRLLWRDGRRTAVAARWQKKFRLIFVDEYQDINDAQDEIIRALGREGNEANRFLVGDVKQSIYRFRLADPGIFRRREEEWGTGKGGSTLALTENFRSHERIIAFVNGLFTTVMRRESGNPAYNDNSRLVFGDRANRASMTSSASEPTRVELHLHHPAKEPDKKDDGRDVVEMEARIIALRLRELKESGATMQTRDGARAVKWSDMAVLLRSPRHKVEAYAKAFAGVGVPLVAARLGFYETMEARDLLNLLSALDNPLQDLPLLGVLHSPFAGLTARDLALVRIGGGKGDFWKALNDWRGKEANKGTDLYSKVEVFLKRFEVWRRLGRQSGVTTCLETALDETQYTAWIGAAADGAQRRANVERFLQLTRAFDRERGEGLARFLKLVEAQQDNDVDIEPATAPATDAVRLMSIHQSKGLEFPVVALGDLGKDFNQRDAQERVIVDEELGLCGQIKPPGSAQFYPGLDYWLAQRRQKRETQGEEMRLLYVALTRAMEWLILAGTVTEKCIEEKWPELGRALISADEAMRCNSYMDWIGGWLSMRDEAEADAVPKIAHHHESPSLDTREARGMDPAEDITVEVVQRLEWSYRFQTATEQAAKTSVSVLRRSNETGDENEAKPWMAAVRGSAGTSPYRRALEASETGSAHHLFLEGAALEKLTSLRGVEGEARRLRGEGRLSEAQLGSLDMDALAAFWQSDVGKSLLEQRKFLRRELAFTARFATQELAALSGAKSGAETAPGEYVVVQGVVDLAALLPAEIWIVDFKTDHFPISALEEKVEQYRSQLALYGAALGRVYKRPVTKSWLSFLNQRKIVLL